MHSLASVQRPLGPLQGVVAGETLWLVQQQDTVEQLPASFRGPNSGNMFSKSRCADVLDQPPGRIVWNLLYPGGCEDADEAWRWSSVAFVGFVRRRELFPAVAAISLIDQLGEVQATLKTFIMDEAQRGHCVNVKQFEQQGVEPPSFLVQSRRSCGWLRAEHREIDLRMRVIGGQVHARQSDEPRSRHVDLALDDAGQILLDLVGKPDVPACVLSSLVSSHSADLESPCDLADLEDLEVVADLDIVVATQGDTAVETRADFLDVVLETTQGFQMTSPKDHVVAQQTDLGVATHHAIRDHTTSHLTDARDAVDLADLDHADDLLTLLRSKHAG